MTLTTRTRPNVVQDSINLANDILDNNADRFESDLDRTQKRMITGLLSYLLSFPYFFVSGLDAWIDAKKINIIQTKKNELDKIKTNNSKEKQAIQFQQKICDLVLSYTRQAKMYKTITAIAGIATCSMIAYHLTTSRKEIAQEFIKQVKLKALFGGHKLSESPVIQKYATTTPGAFWGLTIMVWGQLSSWKHYLDGSSQLNLEKRQLATQAKAELESPAYTETT